MSKLVDIPRGSKLIIRDGLFNEGLMQTSPEIVPFDSKAIKDTVSGGVDEVLRLRTAATFSGVPTNRRMYLPMRVKRGVPSWTNPYAKPLIRNHDTDLEPDGRVKSAKYIDTSAVFTSKDKKLAEVYNAYMRSPNDIDYARDLTAMMIKKTKNSMKRGGPETAGLGYIETILSVIDEEAAERYQTGKAQTFSVGATSDAAYCSVCGANWLDEGFCGHWPGRMYEDDDGKQRLMLLMTGDMDYLEQSEVNVPAAKKAMVLEIMGPNGNKVEDLDLEYIEKHSTPGRFKYIGTDNLQIANGGKAMNLQQLIEKLLKDNDLQLSEDAIKALVNDKKWDLEGEGYKDEEVLEALKTAVESADSSDDTPKPGNEGDDAGSTQDDDDNNDGGDDGGDAGSTQDSSDDDNGDDNNDDDGSTQDDDTVEIDITAMARKIKKQYKGLTAADSRMIAGTLKDDSDEAVEAAYKAYQDRAPTAADLQNLKKSTYFFKREAEKAEDFEGEVGAEKIKDSKFFMIKDSGELTKAVYALVEDQVSVASALDQINKTQTEEFKPLESMNDEELTEELNRIEDEVQLRGLPVSSRLLDDLTFERDTLQTLNDTLTTENKELKDAQENSGSDSLEQLLRDRCKEQEIEVDDDLDINGLINKLHQPQADDKTLIDAKNQVDNPVLNDVKSKVNSKTILDSAEKKDDALTEEAKLVKDFEGMSYTDIAKNNGSEIALKVQKARKRNK